MWCVGSGGSQSICRQLSDGEDSGRVSEEQQRRKVKVSAESIRDGGEWDFRSGGSHWNTDGEWELGSRREQKDAGFNRKAKIKLLLRNLQLKLRQENEMSFFSKTKLNFCMVLA